MSNDLTTRIVCVLFRVGITGCLLAAAIVLAADVSEYPSLNRAGVRALLNGALPLLVLGVVNLLALDGRGGRGRTVATGLAIAGNVLLGVWAARFLPFGGPPLVWVLGGTAALLVVGSIGCARARASRSAN